MLCDESKRMCLRERYGLSKFDAEVEKEYSAARMCESFAEVLLSYHFRD